MRVTFVRYLGRTSAFACLYLVALGAGQAATPAGTDAWIWPAAGVVAPPGRRGETGRAEPHHNGPPGQPAVG
jgi:hypothetical protein